MRTFRDGWRNLRLILTMLLYLGALLLFAMGTMALISFPANIPVAS